MEAARLLPRMRNQAFNSKITMHFLHCNPYKTSGQTHSVPPTLLPITKEQVSLHLLALKECKATQVMALAKGRDPIADIRVESQQLLLWTTQKLFHPLALSLTKAARSTTASEGAMGTGTRKILPPALSLKS
jgi:hypothetical protein